MTKEPWRLEKEQMVRDFHVWNKSAVKGQTVFAGSSLMEMFPVEEWMKELGEDAPIVYNRGVGGYRTTEMKPNLLIRTNEKIRLANEQVKALAARHGQKYIDVNAPLTDELGRLKAEYTIEGMHIKPEGYRTIFEDILRYVRE